MTLPATPFAAGLATLGASALLAYTPAADAAGGSRPGTVEIGAVGVVEILDLDVSKPCAIPDEQPGAALCTAVESRDVRANGDPSCGCALAYPRLPARSRQDSS